MVAAVIKKSITNIGYFSQLVQVLVFRITIVFKRNIVANDMMVAKLNYKSEQ